MLIEKVVTPLCHTIVVARLDMISSNSSNSTSQEPSRNRYTILTDCKLILSVVIKVGMIGDSQIGKTSLMVKYVEGSFDEDYIQTLGILQLIDLLILGVNFMEKSITVRNTDITFSIWDLGGQREFVNMLPLVSNDAMAILFMFDLTRKTTLNSIKEWYRQARGFNRVNYEFQANL